MNTKPEPEALTPPLLEDFHEFSYILDHLKQTGFGGMSEWETEVTQIGELRRKALNFMQWETNPDFSGIRVRVAVIGDFNAGKSSFINSLLGESLCPVEARPTTSSITTFKYGDKEQIFLLNTEGVDGEQTESRKVISRGDYEKRVCHQKGKGLRYEFEVYYPFSGFRDIELYDTPGFGNAQNTDDEQITLAKCDIADALFFIFDINRGNLGEDMRQRLIKIKKKNPLIKICAILNKSDCKSSQAVIEELCKMWRDEGIFGEVISYSTKTEMLQFKESQAKFADFTKFLSNTTSQLIIHQEKGEVFYRSAAVIPSKSRSAVMDQLGNIQQEKQQILVQNVSKDLKSYVKKSRLVVNAIARKIEKSFGNAEPIPPSQLNERLLAVLDTDRTYEDVTSLIKKAVDNGLERRALTNEEKSYWSDPYWRAQFNKTAFNSYIRSCSQTALITGRINKFFEQIPPENFEFVKDPCAELQQTIANFHEVFTSIADEIKKDLPGKRDDFDNEGEVKTLLKSYQTFAEERGYILYSERLGRLVDFIIAHLEKCHMYDLGSIETQGQYIGDFQQKLSDFAERLEFRKVAKLKLREA